MATMTTTQHLGHTAGRARLVAPTSWHGAAAAFRGCGTTGVLVTPVSSYETSGNTIDTTQPANAPVLMANKRTARHLGSRTT